MNAPATIADMPVAAKERLLHVLNGLANSRRFVEFVERNYEIGDEIDEEKREITVVVRERVAAIPPDLSDGQIADLRNLLLLACPDEVVAIDTLGKILRVLGQEPMRAVKYPALKGGACS